jgi:uncharacterized membrane protein
LTSFAPHKSPPPLALEDDGFRRRNARSWPQRLLWTLVGVAILNWSIALYGPASFFMPLAVLVVIAGFWGLVVAIISWMDLEDFPALRRWENTFAWSNALLMAVLIGAWTYVQFHSSPGYTTDELSFDQYAAQLVAHGLHNPYTASMAPAGPLFRLSPDGYTYTISGLPVLQLSYPSLSFLIYVPFILLGWTSEVGAALNMMAWVAAILLMFALLPRDLRAAVLVFSSIDVYLAFAAGGVTDMLYIPLLIIGAYQWDRFGSSRRSYIGPIAVGLAMAIKQTPWPVLAFLLCALAWDEYDRSGNVAEAARRAGRYFAVVVATFLIPNLPYMVASPSAWASGVFVPFVKNMVPSGQGLISLTLFAHLGGGSLLAYTVLFALVALLLLVVFVGTYPFLRPATFLLPSIAYFFAARSQTNYLIALIPVALVGAVTAGPPARRYGMARGRAGVRGGVAAGRSIAGGLYNGSRRQASGVAGSVVGIVRSRGWAWAIAGLGVLVVVAGVYSLTSPAPLKLTIVGKQTTGFLGGINALEVNVQNHTDKPVTPHYTIQTSHGDTTFWSVVSGPKTLRPYDTAQVTISAPNYQGEPGLSDGFSVLAFTNKPATVSVSHRFLLNLWRTATLPQAFDKPVPIGGRGVLLQVEVIDHFNSAVKLAGIPVYLSQARYTPLGFRHAYARINGHPAGRSNVIARTNSQGLATFHIVGTRAGAVPTTISAHLVNKRAGYVYGSSGQMFIHFTR